MASKKRQFRGDRCATCGGPCEPCVDNFGNPYMGCASGCRIVLPPELAHTLTKPPASGGEREEARGAPVGDTDGAEVEDPGRTAKESCEAPLAKRVEWDIFLT